MEERQEAPFLAHQRVAEAIEKQWGGKVTGVALEQPSKNLFEAVLAIHFKESTQAEAFFHYLCPTHQDHWQGHTVLLSYSKANELFSQFSITTHNYGYIEQCPMMEALKAMQESTLGGKGWVKDTSALYPVLDVSFAQPLPSEKPRPPVPKKPLPPTPLQAKERFSLAPFKQSKKTQHLSMPLSFAPLRYETTVPAEHDVETAPIAGVPSTTHIPTMTGPMFLGTQWKGDVIIKSLRQLTGLSETGVWHKIASQQGTQQHDTLTQFKERQFRPLDVQYLLTEVELKKKSGWNVKDFFSPSKNETITIEHVAKKIGRMMDKGKER